VFVVGVSDPFLRSVACGREFDYARALRRVVLPVRVGSVEHEGLVHPELGRWQHVEWRGDKASALQLLGAVAGLDAAPPLPIPAPRPPPVPLSYLGILRAEIVGTDALDFDRQLGIAGRLRAEAQSPDQIPEVRALVALLRERRDLTTYVDRELQRLLDDLGVTSATEPVPRVVPVPPEPPPGRDGAELLPSYPVTAAFEVVILERAKRLVRLELRGHGWTSLVEVRTGWNLRVVHDGVERSTTSHREGSKFIRFTPLELPHGEPVTLAILDDFTLRFVQLRRPDGSVIFESMR
jgi:hypothetical protein